MMGLAVIVGAALSSPQFSTAPWLHLFYGFVTGFTLTAASMAINDYYDREIDAVNEPNRPIPRGLIKPKDALIFAFVLTVIGFASAYLTNIFCFAIAIIAWIIFAAYATIGKKSGLPGNFLVSACVAIPFIYGSYTVGALEPNVLIFALIVFLSDTGREITKGIADVEGDKKYSVKTLAVHFGEKIAAVAAAFFYLFAVILSPIPWFLQLVSFWFIPPVIITDLGLIASSFMLTRNYSRENARRIKKMVLLWFIVGLLAFLLGTYGKAYA
jgi:geranylgeranylglycerol-phosphate geranylgeranyltransferase